MATESLPRPTIDAAVLERAARVIRVLGHPLRLRLLEALEDGERHVAELQEAAGVSQAMVSQQLGILRAHGVVERRREGPRVYYRIIEPKVSRILACIREFDLPNLAAALSALDG
ncbi:MAG: transcriptional regulator, ArsR family [Chloroflexi bacterium CSP1-4]|nr:MAG: transcriptional regulator, ArsR family [Chloroflexi bacterium CSP1-4]